MLRILEARERANLDNIQSDAFASSSTPAKASGPARIPAHTITMLLDDRKHCETRADLEKLAVEYDLPLATIEKLARYYNSPTMVRRCATKATTFKTRLTVRTNVLPPRSRAYG